MISPSAFRAVGNAMRLLLASGAIWAVATMASREEARAEPLPRSSPTAAPTASRALVGAHGVSTIIAGSVLWTADRTYELAGPVIIEVGSTLTIAPGTRVEARPGAYIDISREGRLIADGTPLQPVVMTCTSIPKYEGCWGGLSVRGFGRINFGTATSPADRGSGATGCKESGTGTPLAFGGCDDADSSGVLRYLRVEYAQRGLELLGAGSHTVVDYVQVNRSRTDGLSVVGGAVDVRHLFLTANIGYGMAWKSGWHGRGQFVTVQQDALNNAGGIRGSNIGINAVVLTGAPRSSPALFNVSIVAPSAVSNPQHASGPSALHLVGGTGGIIRNVLIHSAAIAFDIDDEQTCLDFAGALPVVLTHVVIAATNQSGSTDADPFGCRTYATPTVEAQWLGDAANASTIITDPQVAAALIRNGTDLIVPDLRPINPSASTLYPAAVPPNDGFFDISAAYPGAIEPANASRSNVPWYSGWTVAAPVIPAPGTVAGVISAPGRGPLGGAVITTSYGASATAAANGSYSLNLPAGQHVLTPGGLPIGCGAGALDVSVASAATVTLNIVADCTVVFAASTGALHACAQSTAGKIQCWGQNDYGMVGDGTTTTPRLLPTPLFGNLTFDSGTLTSGYTHSCAIRSGAAMCWGLNFFAALGQGTSGQQALAPTPAGNTSTPAFVSVSAGGYHGCALTGTGEAWCWGWNQEGQTGIGSISGTVLLPTPVAAGALRFTQIAAGESHTCALTSAGAAYCWGGNGRGELGQDPNTFGVSSSVPVLVPGGHVFSSIDAGTLHTCAIEQSGGAAYCWGARDKGQLGDGSLTGISYTPIGVATADRFLQISAGGYTTCGVTTGQQLRCWGAGVSGALGNGSLTTEQPSPVVVAGALSVRSVAVNLSDPAGALACAVTLSGEAWCWGAGASGQLGTGTAVAGSAVPVQVRVSAP
ncbi:MAG: hypothetical protein H7Z40_12675 [Phycisphaerae bacterium]|nr:hypothetical protein [Gemmatimonadaceae bacterium]